MFRNRIIQEIENLRLPQPPAPVIAPCAFIACQVVGIQVQQQALYQWAFEQAQAVARPSILERDLLGVWN
jgi:hypothetical protein